MYLGFSTLLKRIRTYPQLYKVNYIHKYLANSMIWGEHLVWLPNCHSTNDEAAHLARNGYPEGTIVATGDQLSGRGQQGTSWQSEPGKNLAMSVVFRPNIAHHDYFLLTMSVALATSQAIAHFVDWPVQVKWPNDLMVRGKKIAGILMESSFLGQKWEYMITGIGINVNQKSFVGLEATSIRAITGYKTTLNEVLDKLIFAWNETNWLDDREKLIEQYHHQLFWRNESHLFLNNKTNQQFVGMIKGVDAYGKLLITTEHQSYAFDTKEIQFLY